MVQNSKGAKEDSVKVSLPLLSPIYLVPSHTDSQCRQFWVFFKHPSRDKALKFS